MHLFKKPHRDSNTDSKQLLHVFGYEKERKKEICIYKLEKNTVSKNLPTIQISKLMLGSVTREIVYESRGCWSAPIPGLMLKRH